MSLIGLGHRLSAFPGPCLRRVFGRVPPWHLGSQKHHGARLDQIRRTLTSTWIRSAPACSASTTCWPKRAKSVARIDGASFTEPLSISQVPRGHISRTVRVARGPVIRWRTDSPVIACSGIGRLKDTLNGRIQHGVVFGIGLLGREPLDQRPRKAGHDAVIPAQAIVGFFPRIPA